MTAVVWRSTIYPRHPFLPLTQKNDACPTFYYLLSFLLAEIKVICQEPAEHACVINRVCGFLLCGKISPCTDQKEKVIKGEIIFNMADLHAQNRQEAQTNPNTISCVTRRYRAGPWPKPNLVKFVFRNLQLYDCITKNDFFFQYLLPKQTNKKQ